MTPIGRDVSPLQARVDVGSFGYAKAQASAGGAAGDLDYLATVSAQTNDGYRDHSDGRQFRGNLNLRCRIAPDLETRFYLYATDTFYLYATDTKQRISGEISKEQALGNPRAANPEWVRQDQQRNVRSIRFVNRQSYGGYMSFAVMTHYSDRLVGGVERYGISDWVSFLNNTEAYRRDNRRAEYGDERDPAMQAVFAEISPMANVSRITKPMLVMQGANDPRVPQSESEQVVARLRENGVETWYVLFADEGHGFQKKHNNDLRREVETVFLQRLFGQVPPARD